MQVGNILTQSRPGNRPVSRRWSWRPIGIAILLAVGLGGTARSGPQSGNSQTTPAGPPRSWTSSQVVFTPPPTAQSNFAAANAERKKQIAVDSARLLKLATDLKAEVDKTDKDTLSLNVIRKADEIEKLAHNVKEKMKLTVVSN